MNLAAAHEAERGIHRSRTIHLPLIKAPHGVGVVKIHPAGVIVETHAQALWHGKHAVAGVGGRSCGRGGDGGGGRSLGDEESAHTQGEEGEGLGELVARVLTAAVVPTVMVVPGDKEKKEKKEKEKKKKKV